MRLTEGILGSIKAGGKVINISSSLGSFSDSHFESRYPQYRISKAALNMYTKVLAAREPMLTTISVNPGWVRTDMGGKLATRTPSEAASDLLWLVKSPIESGSFYENRKLRDW